MLSPKYPNTTDWTKNKAPHIGAGMNITDFHNNVASPASKGWFILNLKIVKEDSIASTTITAIIKNNTFSISKVFSKLASPHNNPADVIDHNNPYIFLTQKIKLKTIIDNSITYT